MKDLFNGRQRFSIRKFSFGAASVLLGMAFLAQAPVVHANSEITEKEITLSQSSPTDQESVATNATADAPASEAVLQENKENATQEASQSPKTSEASDTKAETATTTSPVDKTSDKATGRKTVGYKANAVETPASASMPRREDYRAVTGVSLRAGEAAAASDTVKTADPKDANDKMPTDDQLTDTTKFGKSNMPELKGFNPVYETTPKSGNSLTPAQLTGNLAPFATGDEKKRVAQVWAIKKADGTADAIYTSFVYDLDTQTYELWEYDSNKNLVSKKSVAKTDGSEARIQLAGAGTATAQKQAYVALQYVGKGYQAVYNGTDNINQGFTDQTDVRRVYSAMVQALVPETYSRKAGHYTQLVQGLISGAEIGVHYLIDGTTTQVRDSDKFVGFVGDKYTTTAATDSEFYKDLQNKGYELVTSKNPKYPDGTIQGTYWGGKGFVAVRDVANQGGHNIRVRMTVINDAGDVVFEAWNKTDGTKLPIRWYKTKTTDITNGSPDIDYMTGQDESTTLSEFNYVSKPIKSAVATDVQGEATWGSFAFRIYTKDGMWFWKNMKLSEADRTKAGKGFDSAWSNGWRPSATDIVYWYAKTKSKVEVKYVNTNGETIAADKEVLPLSNIGTDYDATGDNFKPATITKDGKTYRLVKKEGTLPNGDKYNADAYKVSGTDSTAPTGKVTKEDQVITYVYELVQGNVNVKYIDTDGKEIKAPQSVAKNADIDSSYDATTEILKPSTIEKDGTKYYLVEKSGTTTDNKTKYDEKGTATGQGHAPAKGTVKEGDQTVTYVYEKAGNVVVDYISTDGTVLQETKDVVKNGKPNSNYDAGGQLKPATIEYGGKTYKLVTKPGTTTTGKSYDASGVANGQEDATPTGTVEAGKTKNVTYVYEEVKAPVVKQKADITIVAVDADGKPMTVARKSGTKTEPIADGVLETSSVVEGDADGSVQDKALASGFDYQALVKKYQKLGYKVVPGSYTGTGSIANKGDMTEYNGTQTFDNVEGNVQHFVIKLTPIIVPVTPEKPVTPGNEVPEVPTDPNNPTPETPTYPDPQNPKDPKDPDPKDPATMVGTKKRIVEYYVVDKDGKNERPASSENPSIVNKEDTLKFRKEGTINLVTGEVTYPSTWTAEDGTEFKNYTSPDWDGYTVDKKQEGAHTGITEPGADIVDKVVYKPTDKPTPEVKKGSVDVVYVDEDGNVLEGVSSVQKDQPEGTAYTTEQKTFEGYTFTRMHKDSAPASGSVIADTIQHVIYVYKKNEAPKPEVKDDKAVVIYREVDASGKVVKELERTKEFDGKEGQAIQYTGDENQSVIDKYRSQGYRLVQDQYGSGKNYDGKAGVDTYYIDVTPYIVPVTPEKPLTPGGEVPTDPNSPKDPDPKDPKFPNPNIPSHPKDPKYPDPKDPNGGKADDMYKLTEEVNRTITYYAVINGVKTPIANVIPTSKDTLNFQRKGTINLVTGETTLENWNPQTGQFETVTPKTEIEIDGVKYTTSTVVKGETVNPTDDDKFYEVVYTPVQTPETPKGDVIVEYRDEKGNVLKDPRTDTPTSPVGTDYNTDEPGENPSTITKDGVTYERVRVEGKETGKVVEGTTKVVYIYRPVVKKGDVVVKYVIKGTDKEIANPRTDTPTSPVGTEYNTNEEGENPSTITTADGKTYRLVGRKVTSSPETGKVVEGTTVVVYEYEEVVTPTPTPDPDPNPDPNPTPNPAPKSPQLPNTGTESSDAVALAGLGLLGVMAGYGLIRKKKED